MQPYNEEKSIYELTSLTNILEKIGKNILKKAYTMKIIEKFSKNEDINYKLLKYIFTTKVINLEEVYLKLTKEKEKFFINVFDGNTLEEKEQVLGMTLSDQKSLNIRLNKKVRAFY